MKELRIDKELPFNKRCDLPQLVAGITKTIFAFYIVLILICFASNQSFGMSTQEVSKKDIIASAMANPNLEERIEALVSISKQCDDNERFGLLPIIAKTYFKLDEIENAKKYAILMLDIADKHKGSWAYGDVLHDANMILGLVELRHGHIEKAKSYLLNAGDTPGSYLIQHLGPNMMLAKALTELGEQDVVLEYLSKIKNVWTIRNDKLFTWTKSLEGGIPPDFNGNLSL